MVIRPEPRLPRQPQQPRQLQVTPIVEGIDTTEKFSLPTIQKDKTGECPDDMFIDGCFVPPTWVELYRRVPQ